VIISVLLWRISNIYSVDLHEDMRENDFYILIPSDLDLWPLELKFAPLVNFDLCYVSAKL